jgi:hypothetical protein
MFPSDPTSPGNVEGSVAVACSATNRPTSIAVSSPEVKVAFLSGSSRSCWDVLWRQIRSIEGRRSVRCAAQRSGSEIQAKDSKGSMREEFVPAMIM